MLQQWKTSLGCLVIVCLLLSGCKIPKDFGRQTLDQGSQKQQIFQGETEKKTNQSVKLQQRQLSVTNDRLAGSTVPQMNQAKKNVLVPSNPGTTVYSDSTATFDVSNASEGYVMVKYEGNKSKIKLRITKSGGTTYTYNLNASGTYETFPLSAGDGSYSIQVFENVSGNQYAPGLSKTISVKLNNSVGPFLYPNKFVNFNESSTAVTAATSLAQSSATDLEFVEKVYKYTMEKITYDTAKAAVLGTSDYVPNVNDTLATGTGVCFDYASVMASMLRSQGIPTKLVVGIMNGNIRHAWISVYITDVGWINGILQFDGKNWVRMDPTTADQNNEAYTATDSNYQTLYVY